MQTLYTLIMHKSDSYDYCRGCLMDSYTSDFEFSNYLTRDTLIERLAELAYKNLNLRINESGYKFIVLKDGVVLYNDIDEMRCNTPDYVDRVYGIYNENDPQFYDKLEEAERMSEIAKVEIGKIMSEAKTFAQNRIDQEKLAKQQAEIKQKELDQKRHEENQRAHYEQLKKKFEPS